MMFDYSEKKEFSPIEPGSYEVQISNAEMKQSANGKNYIAVTFIIRDDVEQEFKNRYIWDNIWENDVYRNAEGKRIKKDDYNAMTPEQKQTISVTKEYDDIKIRTLIQAQDADSTILDMNGNRVPNPKYKTTFSNLEEVVMFLNGLNVIIQVTKYMDDKSGMERNGVEYKGIKRTRNHQTVNPAVSQNPATVQQVQSNTNDDKDLPW